MAYCAHTAYIKYELYKAIQYIGVFDISQLQVQTNSENSENIIIVKSHERG